MVINKSIDTRVYWRQHLKSSHLIGGQSTVATCDAGLLCRLVITVVSLALSNNPYKTWNWFSIQCWLPPLYMSVQYFILIFYGWRWYTNTANLLCFVRNSIIRPYTLTNITDNGKRQQMASFSIMIHSLQFILYHASDSCYNEYYDQFFQLSVWFIGIRRVSILNRYYWSLQIWILVCATIMDNFSWFCFLWVFLVHNNYISMHLIIISACT